ncbi:hypothetical protein [Flectobacillus sp. BAB-3569]|uniref:hypothetical protein n=1 Tax=Flectobacillus sp. BAB-3569 TaxID=1509483 RepID=UPI000BA3B4E7|nr:hypothetical protein [Flectobacillus sp. BAB-3569]PAC29683.1 hypothetical protein BWI92_14370 [Flectobacillus sp. BAB-3569]
MFKLYQVVNKVREEVLPVNELYTVNELGEYEFYYNNYSKIDIDSVSIFIEDLEIERKNYIVTENSIYSKEANRFFQDYFGFASLNINNEVFKFNILIEKFNIVEIENILLFLWNCENKLFENFFSKSTINSKILNSGYNYEYTSKLLTFANSFYDFFRDFTLLFVIRLILCLEIQLVQ